MLLMAARPGEGEHAQHASDKPYDGCEKTPFGLLQSCTHRLVVAAADEYFVVVLGSDIPFIWDFDAQSSCGSIEPSRFNSDFFFYGVAVNGCALTVSVFGREVGHTSVIGVRR